MGREYYRKHAASLCLKEQQFVARIKKEVMLHYSPTLSCALCGYNANINALELHHLKESGNAHRRQVGSGPGNPFYKWLKKNGFPEGYQVLCANCHRIITFDNLSTRGVFRNARKNTSPGIVPAGSTALPNPVGISE